MVRTRMVLQPPIQITTRTTQKNEDAARVGNNRQGVVFVDVYQISGGTLTITIDTCSTLDASAGGGSSWITVGTKTFTAVGSNKIAITDLGDAIRYDADTGTQSATFSLRAFMSDE